MKGLCICHFNRYYQTTSAEVTVILTINVWGYLFPQTLSPKFVIKCFDLFKVCYSNLIDESDNISFIIDEIACSTKSFLFYFLLSVFTFLVWFLPFSIGLLVFFQLILRDWIHKWKMARLSAIVRCLPTTCSNQPRKPVPYL